VSLNYSASAQFSKDVDGKHWRFWHLQMLCGLCLKSWPVDLLGLRYDELEIRREGRVNHSLFGYDGVDEFGGCDVKGGVEH
jgi:hypothetical protein